MSKVLIAAVLLAGLTGAFGMGKQSADGTARTPVLLELFTSEGCSSCPPADRLLQSLDEKQPFSGADLIVLSEHVDYWNNSAWVDPYSSKLFSERQQSYADYFGLDSTYTPQLIVDGQQETVGSNAVEVRKAIETAMHDQKIALTLTNVVRDGSRIKFHLTSAELPMSEGAAIVYVAFAENKVQSHVDGGENSGRSLIHVAVVRAFATLGKVRGGSSFSKDVTIPIASGAALSGFRIVAFLQDDKSRKIVGATYQKIPG